MEAVNEHLNKFPLCYGNGEAVFANGQITWRWRCRFYVLIAGTMAALAVAMNNTEPVSAVLYDTGAIYRHDGVEFVGGFGDQDEEFANAHDTAA